MNKIDFRLKQKILNAMKIREAEEVYNLAVADDESLILIMLLALYENI